MIDLITIQKLRLSENEIKRIVERNYLQTNSKDGVVCYDNKKIKNLAQAGGFFINIGTDNKLKVEGSLHKFYNKEEKGIWQNYNFFDMEKACSAAEMLIEKKSLPSDMMVYYYEVGLNMNVSKDCMSFLEKIKSIGPAFDEKKIYTNPRYKDERAKTTIFHKHTRKYFKVYDKEFEMHDRKRTYVSTGKNILRIETANRRLENKPVELFFDPDNLYKIVEQFFRDWRTLKFEYDIITPKGTGRTKHALCLEILRNGRDEVLSSAKERYKMGILTDWEFRNIREFITKDYDVLKKDIQIVKSPEEVEYRELLSSYYALLKGR